MSTLAAILILILALIIGIPVPFAFLASTAYLIFHFGYDPSFLLPYAASRMNSIVILAIPLFIVAGGLINRGNIGNHLVDLVELLVGRVRGGLGSVMVVACAVFGSITGSAAATLTAIGTILFPRLNEAGYPRGHSAALMASSSVLGMLIPPSSMMIMYAWIGRQSVLAAFLACLTPGVILTALLCCVNVWLMRNQKGLIGHTTYESPRAYVREFSRRTRRATPALFMPFLILGGIYGGFVTPTEAAGLAALYAIPVGFWVYRGLTIRGFIETVLDSAVMTGVIMVMLFAVLMLSRLYVMEGVPTLIMDTLTQISNNPLVLILMINLFMIIIGMLMDDLSSVMLCTPLLLPLVIQLDIDPIQFAAILGVNLGMGNITPPTAPLLYLAGQLNQVSITETMRPTLYMLLFAWLPTLLLTTYVPEVSLWLPHLLLG
jgi:C4-dicarboxylate transporter DctM subunit